eukprot:scaffold64049_cov31-Prasinocladus_malaysianus.AAC.1
MQQSCTLQMTALRHKTTLEDAPKCPSATNEIVLGCSQNCTVKYHAGPLAFMLKHPLLLFS